MLLIEGFATGQTAVETTVAARIGVAADHVADKRTGFGILRDVGRVRVCLEEGVDDDGRHVVVDVIDGELEELERERIVGRVVLESCLTFAIKSMDLLLYYAIIINYKDVLKFYCYAITTYNNTSY